MEELQTRHRKEQRDLQSRVTQKKKQASKKTRKAVNDECERLETELKERQAREIAELNGEAVGGEDEVQEKLEELTLQTQEQEQEQGEKTNGVEPETETKESDPDEEAPTTQQAQGKKRNRQKERLARRAAEQEELALQAADEARNLPDLKQQERTRMLESMSTRNLSEIEIRADGHCLYSAVADQLKHLEIPINNSSPASAPDDKPTILPYKLVRAQAASYIASHQDDFVPFLEEPLDDYLHKIRDTGEWGGQLELMALAKTYGVDINVLQDFGRVEKIEGSGEEKGKKDMWLGYYKHGFGLGEHYNSLRRKEGG